MTLQHKSLSRGLRKRLHRGVLGAPQVLRHASPHVSHAAQVLSVGDTEGEGQCEQSAVVAVSLALYRPQHNARRRHVQFLQLLHQRRRGGGQAIVQQVVHRQLPEASRTLRGQQQPVAARRVAILRNGGEALRHRPVHDLQEEPRAAMLQGRQSEGGAPGVQAAAAPGSDQ